MTQLDYFFVSCGSHNGVRSLSRQALIPVRKIILIAAAAAAVVAAAVVLPFVATIALDTVASVAGECSEGEKRVFREFTQYDGRHLEPGTTAVPAASSPLRRKILPRTCGRITGSNWRPAAGSSTHLRPPSKPRKDKPRAEV
jgi:hypothetical protein